MMDLNRTIVAISSGVAAARRCVVRISGPETQRILATLLTDSVSPLNAVRAAQFPAVAQFPVAGVTHSLPISVYFWPDQRCFTGQPSAELHVLGSLPLVECLTEHLINLGAHLAERGEFTLRSFLAGKMDLAQAEAVLGVIEADSNDDMQLALSQLAGGLSDPVRELRNRLIELTAHLEAGLDFVEEDIEFISTDALVEQLSEIHQKLSEISHRLQTRGSRNRTPTVVLSGLPNAGKSSLFNALCRNERAIVSDQEGTTRDAISASVQLDDEFEIELVDTAGMEELSNQSPRALAQTVLRSRLAAADAILFCFDLNERTEFRWAKNQIAELQSLAPTLVVGTKSDLVREQSANTEVSAGSEMNSRHDATIPEIRFDARITVSDPRCIAKVRTLIRDLLAETNTNRHADAIHHMMVRCRESIDKAAHHLMQAIDNAEFSSGEEIVAADLRSAIYDLSAVIGEVHNEDILDQIFSRFCIGK